MVNKYYKEVQDFKKLPLSEQMKRCDEMMDNVEKGVFFT